MAESTWNWLLTKQFEERSTNIRTAWDLYIKFYIAFLALNIAGIGAVVQYVERSSRGPIVTAFSLHNLLAIGTTVIIWRFTKKINLEMEQLADLMRSRENVEVAESGLVALRAPLPTNLVYYSCWANAITHLGLTVCWVWLLRGPDLPEKCPCPGQADEVAKIVLLLLFAPGSL